MVLFRSQMFDKTFASSISSTPRVANSRHWDHLCSLRRCVKYQCVLAREPGSPDARDFRPLACQRKSCTLFVLSLSSFSHTHSNIVYISYEKTIFYLTKWKNLLASYLVCTRLPEFLPHLREPETICEAHRVTLTLRIALKSSIP